MTQKVKGSAPGPYLGYSLQQVRLFYYLISCSEDSSVGLEHEDDISVHENNKTILAEQCKSALSSNPTTDWAVDFWKTFATWIENTHAGLFYPPDMKFILYVAPNKKPGKYAQQLSDAVSDDEIARVLKKIGVALARKSPAPKCKRYASLVLQGAPFVVFPIVKNFNLNAAVKDPLSPIYDRLAPIVSPELAELGCRYGIGCAKELVDQLIRDKKKPVIVAHDFRKKFRAYISKHDSSRILHSLAEKPTDEIIQSTLSEAPPFVQQLQLIDAEVEEITRAASDFLRSSADRTKWAEDGLIYEGSIGEYEEELERRFENVKVEVGITQASLSKTKRGKLIYSQCCANRGIPLEGRVVPTHYLPGTMNDMANRLKIGWHPKYKELLETDE